MPVKLDVWSAVRVAAYTKMLEKQLEHLTFAWDAPIIRVRIYHQMKNILASLKKEVEIQ